MNYFMLVGRIVSITEIKDSKAVVKIEVAREKRNNQGDFDIDSIDITLKDNIAKTTKEYCKQDDVIGVKGSIECLNNKLELVASNVSFLKAKES